ncbi:hypothetical protein [Dactylosporangium sp. NPDC051484]|uniref:hypothetical protein n=1 Tax=Dactylosporangium sp. NPDC051484 TaxID=3154942 RepID=UPI00344C15DB
MTSTSVSTVRAASWRPATRAVALLVTAGMILAGCGAKPSSEPKRDGNQRFATTGIDTERIGAPVSVNAGDTAAAATLADLVMKGGPGGTAALATAVNLAGITITGANGKVFRGPANPAIGQTLQAGEIGLLASAQVRGDSRLLMAPMLAAAIGALDPRAQLDEKAIMNGLLTDLRTAMAGKNATDAFIATFVIELEKRGATPRDLTKDVADPAAVRLSPVATTLLLLRLTTSIQAAFPKDVVKAAPRGGATAKPAGHAAGKGGYRLAGESALDCAVTPSEGVDDFIYDRLGDLGSAAGVNAAAKAAAKAGLAKFGAEALGLVVSTVLGFAKLIVAGAFFKPTMEMSPEKLERTRSASQDGAKAVVKVTLKFDTEGWEVANCFRSILSVIGLDFSFKGSGVVKNAEVVWKPGDGFSAASNGLPLVKIDQATPVGVAYEKTNDKGQAAATVIGHRQPKQVPDTAKKVEKTFYLAGTYNSKPDDYWEDLFEALGIVATVVVGGPAGWAAGAIKLALSALERGGWYEFGKAFPVTDYGGDYRIDTTISGITFTGTVCDGPAGIWNIKLAGKAGSREAGWTYTGSAKADVKADGTGPISGVLKGTSSTITGFGALNSSAPFNGTVKVHDAGQTAWMEIKLTGAGSELAGPNGLISTGGGSGTFTLPVDVGNFCGT